MTTGASLELDHVNLTASGDAIYLSAPRYSTGSSAIIRNSDITVNGTHYGLNLNGDSSTITIENSTIANKEGMGIWLIGAKTQLTATDFEMDSFSMGIESRGGGATINRGAITSLGNGAYGLYLSAEKQGTRLFDLDGVTITTHGDRAGGARARQANARILLKNSSVTTHGAGSHALYTENNALIQATNTQVKTTGAGAIGAIRTDQGRLELDSTQITTQGADAHGIWSYITAANQTNTQQLSLSNGSSIDTQDGVALLITGGNHEINLTDSTINARAGGDPSQGLLLQSRPVSLTNSGVTTSIETNDLALNVSGGLLDGHIQIESGFATISLANRTAFTGAVREIDQGEVTRLSLDTSSAWHISDDSSVHHLANEGHVVFLHPTETNDEFKVLHTHNYSGDGFIIMNTYLGGDDSGSDLMIIDGGTTTGTSLVKVNNTGGDGSQTNTGILVIETINGATTHEGNFVLSPTSRGYRPSTETIADHGCDYSLLRGGHDGIEDDWYLVSSYVERPIDPPPVDPGPVDPPAPIDPTPPTTPTYQNVSPETGAYIGNKLASKRLFTHQLHDRIASETPGDQSGRNVWVRIQAGHDRDLSLSEGRLDVDTNHTVVQFGGDLFQHHLGDNAKLHVGWLAGYGEARTDAKSTFYLPRTRTHQDVTAHGKTKGYSVGAYATVYENAGSNVGAYGDTWFQYSHLNHTLSSELGSVRYNAKLLSLSLEGGYGFQPFSAESILGNLVITPNAQVVYSHYKADETVLSGMRMNPGKNSGWQTRMGVRFAPLIDPRQDQTGRLRPFMEVNWLHNSEVSVRTGDNTMDVDLSRNSGQLKLGADGQISRHVFLSGNIYGQAGTKGERAYGGMINARYQW